MATFSRPGVYVQEVSLPQQITLPDTGSAAGAMSGALYKGNATDPQLVQSWGNFVKTFGGLNDSYPLTWAAYNFFANGGTALYVRRIVGTGSANGSIPFLNQSASTTTLTATVTAASSQSTTATVTAAQNTTFNGQNAVVYTSTNTFVAGQTVNITGLTGTTVFNLSGLIAQATGSNFTVVNAATGTAVSGATATATAVSNTITYTAVNTFTAGQTVNITGLTGTPGFNIPGTIATATGSNFTVTSAVTGSPVSGATGTATVTITANTVFTLQAKNPGTWSGDYSAQVVPAGVSTRFGINIFYTSGGVTNLVESYTDLSMDATDKYYVKSVIDTSSALVTISSSGLPNAYFPYTGSTTATAFTGGANGTGLTRTDYSAAWTSFDPIQNPLVIYAADAPYQTTTLCGQIHGDAMIYAASRDDAFVVIDTPSGLSVSAAKTQITATMAVAAGSTAGGSAASYFPWVNIPDGNKIPGATRLQAPGAAVVGQYLSTDKSRGVFKTPAGLGNKIALAVSTERLFTNSELDDLNTYVDPINAIRNVPGAGIVIMGGRTLDNTPTNRYINIRRSLIFIEKQVKDISAFAVFENNDSRLWLQLRTGINNFLLGYWQQGGLRGASPAEAYYVKVDSSTTTWSDIQNGRVNIEVGIALQYPAEFVVIKIGQLTGSATA